MKRLTLTVLLALTAVSLFAQGLLNRNPRRSPAVARPTSTETTASSDEPGEASDLNFNQTPIDLVFETYGKMVGKTILKDPQTPTATISLKTSAGQKLSKEEQIEAIEIVLEMNGIHLEPYGEKFVRAIPRKDARTEGIPMILDQAQLLAESGKVVSMMIEFKNISYEEAQKALEGFKSKMGVLNVFERTNSILVTDTQQNINRMLEIAKLIDVATPVLENVFTRQVRYASASDIKTVLEAIVQDSQKEIEKAGKGVSNVQNQPPRPTLLARGRVNQPQEPQNNASLVTGISDADRGMIRGKVMITADERSNKLIIITSKANMDFFDKVIEQLDVETTPDTVVKVYRLKYADAEEVSDMINDLIGNAAGSKSGRENQNANARNGTGGNMTRNTTTTTKKPANQRTGETKAGELTKDNTTVLADKRINGLVVMTQKDLVPTIEEIVEKMDIKLSQVLIETCIVEVQLGDDIRTGMDWVKKGKRTVSSANLDASGNQRYQVFSWEDAESVGAHGGAKPVGFASSDEFESLWDSGKYMLSTLTAPNVFTTARDGVLNYASGGTYGLVGGGSSGASAYTVAEAINAGSGVVSNMFGKAFNFVFDSDKLGIAGILQASKTDSHSKYIASPVIMTLDNKEAVINATAMHYLLKGFTSSGNSYSTIAVPDYEQKELGIEIKVTPKINPNGTVMLTVEEKYTQLGKSEEIQYSSGNTSSGVSGLQAVSVPTTVTREMSSDVLLENNQTVVFAGLTDKNIAESETGIPFLKDIPWIGKWLFSNVEQTETRTELLVFMTPYVLDDAEAAQAEALRRKKTMSDPRPWDDDGWSLSPLADPVSRKEQIRRLKDEARKQDEERKTKIAIEQWKVERAKKLKELSKEERDLWLKMHKEELEDEDRDELEEKMLDENSQEELKKLAETVKAKKLAEAEIELKKMEDETAAENEYSKREKAKSDESAAPAEPADEMPAEE